MACIAKALIVGAGPSGLTAAIALTQKGVSCDLVEITPTGEPLGAAITLWGRAVDAFEEIGVVEKLRAEQGDPSQLGGPLLGMDGKPVASRPDRAEGQGPSGEALGLYRPILSRILLNEARALGVKVRLGTTVETLEETPDGVLASLSDGHADRYDLVIGADGIRSRVRRLAFGDDIRPQFAGEWILRWMAPGPPIEAGPTSSYHGPFGRMLGYPLARQNMTYVAVVLLDAPSHHLGPDEARAMLREILDGFTAPYAVELRRRLTDDQEVIFRPYEWLLMPDPWHRGRIMVIGDAAHATTAHLASGGAMAVEDAVVLAQEVDRAATLEAALKAFMKRRFDRVRFVVDTSLAVSQMEKRGARPDEIAGRVGSAQKELMAAY